MIVGIKDAAAYMETYVSNSIPASSHVRLSSKSRRNRIFATKYDILNKNVKLNKDTEKNIDKEKKRAEGPHRLKIHILPSRHT